MKISVHRNSSKKVISVLVLGLIALIQIHSPQIFLNNLDNEETQDNLLQNTDFLPEDIQNPISQSYTQSLTGSKDNVEVSIHQAYESSSIQNIDEVSDTLSVLAPNATDFNVSKSDLVINNINLNNYTQVIESQTIGYETIGNLAYLNSFTAPIDCLLSNISFYIRETAVITGDLNLVLSPANSTDSTKPLLDYNELIIIDQITITASTLGWITHTNIEYFLNNSLTTNNTWFIGLNMSSGSNVNVRWYFYPDTSVPEDKTMSYGWVGGWTLLEDVGDTIDLTTEIGFGFSDPKHTPSEINLKINGQTVHNNSLNPSHNSGYWDYTGYGSNGGNSLDYVFTADWYDFSLEVNQTIINYTKTFPANITTFSVESGMKAYWETQSNFTLMFDHRLDNNTVNFTIPYSWMEFNLTRDASTITHTTQSSATNQTITVFGSDALDGDWALYCNSTNMVTNVQVGIGGVGTAFAYSNDTVSINATLVKSLSENVNLSVYNPVSFGDEINYTKLAAPSGTTVDFGDWIVNDTISDYGEYRVQVHWENSTDVGIYETTLYVAGASNYTITNVDGEEYLKDPEEIFNITIFYDNIMENEPIAGANISYDLTLGAGWQHDDTQANADNSYNITINSSLYTVGLHEIPIKINKSKYMNYTTSYSFLVVNNTQTYEYTQASTLDVIRGQNATYIFNFNQTWLDDPITGATITENLN
ncbi:MAG: hypothetical protein ACTSRK_17790, partial [Promethearchaeota archaeon]